MVQRQNRGWKDVGRQAGELKGRDRRVLDVEGEAGASSDTGGSRVIEGIELVKTYRVLDGVAGVEFPTSTTKSVLRLVRPSDPLSQQPSSS